MREQKHNRVFGIAVGSGWVWPGTAAVPSLHGVLASGVWRSSRTRHPLSRHHPPLWMGCPVLQSVTVWTHGPIVMTHSYTCFF